MRTRITLTRDGDMFVARISVEQAMACSEALAFLRGRGLGTTALAVQLGASPETVGALAERLAGGQPESFELRLTTHELHILHSALTAAATMFVSHGRFSQEPFHIRLGFFRETFDALALGIVEAVSEVSA
ncbi:hypothetical protein [Streptomyces sp. NBC_01451]|uniref:hypothetical protein n=1 Tax=Streptomyces sp. NBC_01451 TaxID=2903872 RepID=UPI002E325422|nr:hypothetical protein [Streptomyces sp. NBC_01451]